MPDLKKLSLGVATLALVASASVASAEDKVVSMIQCGDELAEGYDGFIAEWEKNNPGYKVETEVVGWGQCQDKATNLAVAGTPIALAYMGSRTLKQLSENGLIVPIPMSEEEKAS
ncbi:extracellular solute-binding protein, partial [Martelella sp. UBA3392]